MRQKRQRRNAQLPGLFIVIASALLALGSAAADAAPIDNVFVFGDSLLDVGNLFIASGGTTPPSPPYDAGRFSNGPLAVELFAAHFGVTLTPSLAGGSDFAFAGAFAQATPVSGVPNVIDQVNGFVAALGANPADADAMYVLDGGGNDIVQAVITGDPSLVAAALAADQQSIQALAAAGARHLLIYDAPDIGSTPDFSSTPGAGAATALSVAFNTGLSGIVAGDRMAGIDIHEVDLFGLEHAIFADPAAFGFSNVSDPCLVGTVVCANPDQYFYWDGFHPTAHTGRLLGAAMIAAVPEPPLAALLVVALAALAIARRRVTASGVRHAT